MGKTFHGMMSVNQSAIRRASTVEFVWHPINANVQTYFLESSARCASVLSLRRHTLMARVLEGKNKQNKINELYFIPITVHRKTWSSNMDDNTIVEKHDNIKN